MKLSNRAKVPGTLLVLGMGLLLCSAIPGGRLAFAQTAAEHEAKSGPIDEYDRVTQLWYYQRFATSGWQRGMEIYFMKCRKCHNDYAIKSAKPGDPATGPTLRGLFERPRLLNGASLTEENVKALIRAGGRGKPAYYPSVLSDKDLDDLVAYLRGHCCWDEMNPPANPRYRVQ